MMVPSRHPMIITGARIAVGLVWLVGALFNLTWSLRHPSAFTDALATDATFAASRWFFGDVVARAPAFWIGLLVITETALGLLMLGRGRLARIGLAGSALFSAFLFLVIWPYTLMMGAWVVLALVLLRFEHQRSIVDLLRPRIHAGRKATGTGA